jgi:hypothetical protein
VGAIALALTGPTPGCNRTLTLHGGVYRRDSTYRLSQDSLDAGIEMEKVFNLEFLASRRCYGSQE